MPVQIWRTRKTRQPLERLVEPTNQRQFGADFIPSSMHNPDKTAPVSSQANAICHQDTTEFYVSTLKWLLEQNILTREMKLLVVCGAVLDRDVLAYLGFHAATISNLEAGNDATTYAPFASVRQDVEALSFADDAFDFCIAHNGLHHCLSPHHGLLEMCRVARRGVIVFEPRDSLLARLGVKLNFGQQYETAAVAANGSIAGGVRNTAVPNYVYRWTEREIEKTVSSFWAWGKPKFIYRYALRIPWGRLRMMNNRLFFYLVRALQPLLRLFFLCFPKQANGFAFVVLKPQLPQDLHPWLESKSGQMLPNQEWMTKQYGSQKNDRH